MKTPNQGYREEKFAAAGFPIIGYETAPELGYVVVAEEMKGRRLSGSLVDAIIKEIGEPAFATTDDNTMRNNLQRSGFTRAGREWRGRKGMLLSLIHIWLAVRSLEPHSPRRSHGPWKYWIRSLTDCDL